MFCKININHDLMYYTVRVSCILQWRKTIKLRSVQCAYQKSWMCRHTCFIGVTVYGFTSIILHVMLQKSQIGCRHEENVYCCLGNHYTVGYTHNHQKQICVLYSQTCVFSKHNRKQWIIAPSKQVSSSYGFPHRICNSVINCREFPLHCFWNDNWVYDKRVTDCTV